MKGQMEYYQQIGVSIEEYVQTIGIRNLIKEKLLDLALDVFVFDYDEKLKIKERYNKQYFLLEPLEFEKLLPFN